MSRVAVIGAGLAGGEAAMEFVTICWEVFKGPLAVLAAPAAPLLLICLAGIAVMTIRELRKK